MNDELGLAGECVMVVEDDWLLAWDTKVALTRAGATVVGPFAQENEAEDAIRGGQITAAVTDINLGEGPSFTVAKALRKARVPFAFLTGYDQSVIPEEFGDTLRFIKPIDTGRLARDLSRFLRSARLVAGD